MRCRPGSFPFLVALFIAGALFAGVWTQLGYRESNLERQGVDIVHHAVIVHQVNAPGGLDRQTFNKLADYPNTSHRLAALTLPWFGDALLALRFAALTTVCWLLALQFTLLCRFLPWIQAAVVVLLWQLLCCWGKVSNPYHFWEGMYNYSRAVGGLGLWGGLLLLTIQPASVWLRRMLELLAVAAAVFALACHLVPGAVALGGLLLYALAGWLRERRPERLILLLVTLVAGAGMYFGTSVWKVMVDSAGLDGWLPVGPVVLLLTWIPVAGLAAWFLIRPIVRRAAQSPISTWLPTEALMTALLAAGGLQTVTFLRMVLWESCAPYAVKSLFFYTFPLASLLGVVWLMPWCRQLPAAWQGYWQTAERRKLLHVLAGGLLLASIGLFYHQDRGLRSFIRLNEDSASAKRYYPTRDQLPSAVIKALAAVAPAHQGWYYLDPNQPFGAFYASILGLHVEFNTAIACRDRLLAHDYAALASLATVRGILLPAPAAGALPLPSGQAVGPFREYLLPTAKAQSEP